ncbi:MAG TPA: TOMM precursor leader peptide-binding protein [Candidatus Dormibacteraeota bacterium]|nr:TOMM precursor leader peptide-binding protein [Candidatus Dormibacteraeota bacterium]
MPVALLRPSPAWTLSEQEGGILVSGGGDANYLVEAPSPEVIAEVVGAWRGASIDRASLSAGARRVLDVLVSARVVDLELEAPDRKVGVRFVGAPNHALTAQLDPTSEWDLLVVIRTNGRLSELTDEAFTALDRPHMLVDLAYNHVASFGPLVIPGETACLSCLAGRVAANWGDAAPPARPAMTDRLELVASLIALHVEQAFEGRSQLINQTLAYDFEEHDVKRNRLYKLPYCARCGDSEQTDGRLALPWEAAR